MTEENPGKMTRKHLFSGLGIIVLLVLFLNHRPEPGVPSPPESAPAPSTTSTDIEIRKSETDQRDYHSITLDNRLEVLLISDPAADKAAAALDIRVGSGNDPEGWSGLAHFMEHMLFLGTEKYPEPDEYQKFIARHGGHHNAYTALENSNYFFEVDHRYLEPALDRFAAQFTSPVFAAEFVEREKNAVHSEYVAKLKDDNRRLYSAEKLAYNPNHPFTGFTVGSLDTLKDQPGLSARDALIQFYNSYYSANLMKVVIYGREPLEQLETWAREKFSAIPGFDKPVPASQLPLFNEGQLPRLLTVDPVKEQRILGLTFPLPSLKPHYREKPGQYLGHLLGQEGEGSLLSFLKARGWAESLYSGVGLNLAHGSTLNIRINLTSEGIANYQDAVKSVFAYLNLVRSQGVEERLFREQQQLAEIAFRFQEKIPPMEYVTRLASQLQRYPTEDVIYGPFRMDTYDPALYETLLADLTPDNVLITLMTAGVPTDGQTPFYDAPYALAPLDEPLQQTLAKARPDPVMAIPSPNPFIPEQLSLLRGNGEAIPEQVTAFADMQAWYGLDTTFGDPKAGFYVSLRSPVANESARHAVLTHLLTRLVNDSLAEFSYPALVAGLDYQCYKHSRGISIKLSGFYEKQDLLLEEILKTLTGVEFSQQQFVSARQELERQLANSKKDIPYKQVLRRLPEDLMRPFWSDPLMLAELNEVRFEDIAPFRQALLAQAEVVTLGLGNLSQDQADTLNRKVQQYLVTPSTRVTVNRPRVIDAGTGQPWMDELEIDHPDNAYLLYLQGENDSIENRARFQMLSQLAASDFFDQLRTRQQLGYYVFAFNYPMLEVPGLAFVVQSPSATADRIDEATRGFIEGLSESLTAMTEAEFSQHQSALMANLLEQDHNIKDRMERYWKAIDAENFDFNTRQQIADAVQLLTRESVQAFIDESITGPGQRRLMIMSQGNLDPATHAAVQTNLSKAGYQPLIDKETDSP